MPCRLPFLRAGKAHDVMALKCRGQGSPLNFGLDEYGDLVPMLPQLSKACACRLCYMFSDKCCSCMGWPMLAIALVECSSACAGSEAFHVWIRKGQ